jgi:hypothetical protein
MKSLSMMVLFLALANTTLASDKPVTKQDGTLPNRVICDLYVHDYSKEKLKDQTLAYKRIILDFNEEGFKTQTFQYKHEDKEILFVIDSAKFKHNGSKVMNLQVYDRFDVREREDDNAYNFRHSLAGTLVGLPELLDLDASGYLDVHIPGTDRIFASYACMGDTGLPETPPPSRAGDKEKSLESLKKILELVNSTLRTEEQVVIIRRSWAVNDGGPDWVVYVFEEGVGNSLVFVNRNLEIVDRKYCYGDSENSEVCEYWNDFNK